MLTVTGAAYDDGVGANNHTAIFNAIHDHINGVTFHGGTGSIDGLRFEPLPPPKNKGRPQKIERDVALALAHRWFETFFISQDKLPPSAARAKACAAVVDMWQKSCWQGAADESALRKNIKKTDKELHGLYALTYIAPDPSKSFVAIGKTKDFDIEPHKRMRFAGTCWIWRYGEQHAQYTKASIPETLFLQN
ncbi:MAG: hypothetical protein K2X65_03285 [Burkholderiaceae bacterium]|nr:hypothetical protein [Burkholderiaceae bacterium]